MLYSVLPVPEPVLRRHQDVLAQLAVRYKQKRATDRQVWYNPRGTARTAQWREGEGGAGQQ